MQNLQDELVKLLFNEENLVVDNQLNKNKIIESALKVEPFLINLLIKDKTFKKHFFQEIGNVLVFDKIKFQRFVNNKSFLPNSYTAFKNKIGLTINDETTDNFIKSNNDVVLAWPHKDCFLEGGQTKEEQKRSEIFWNEILAPENVDRLLDAKAFTNFKKHDVNGEQVFSQFERDSVRNKQRGLPDDTITDNLVIKGNNLLALHSLKKEFRGKIKLIYIDPPYNTGGDTFQYNDSFNHSTWLVFMKNRLEVAYDLLSEDGIILIQCDHHEIGYLNVVCDEIFNSANKVQQIAVKVSAPSGFKAVNPGPIDVTEYILFYSKDKSKVNFQKCYVPTGYHSNYNKYLKNEGDISNWKLLPLKDVVLKNTGYSDEKSFKKEFGDGYKVALNQLISDFAYNNANNVVSIRDLHKPTKQVSELQKKSKNLRDTFFEYTKQDGKKTYLINGGALAFYSSKLNKVNGEIKVTELLTNFWNHISWAGIANEGGVKLKNGKKPEKLLKQIFELTLLEGDIVLDYHLGSGTTCAAAHKLGLQYIGIEQLDYGENDSVIRLKNVIDGDMSGISKYKDVNWKGGGSFVKLDLMQYNHYFVDKIQSAKTKEDLLSIWNKMRDEAFLSYQFNKDIFNERLDAFKTASLEKMQHYLIEVLDKNQLYVNFSEIEDAKFNVSDEDKELNYSFYKK